MRRSTLPSISGGRKRRIARWATAAAVVVGALSLAGCAGEADLGPLDSGLADVPGTSGAVTWTTHPGAPWNTEVQVLLYVDDATETGLVDVVRAAAPVISDDAVAARHPVRLWFVDGDAADHEDGTSASSDAMAIPPSVFEALGVDARGGRSIAVSADDLRRIAGS